MSTSTITSKGQITIPKEIRKALGLKPQDKVLFLKEAGRIILYPLKGNILDVQGTVRQKGILNFKEVREETKRRVSQHSSLPLI